MTDALKVLIIEDDPDIVLGCEQALQLEDIPVIGVDSAEAALKHVGPDFAGIVISDIHLPGIYVHRIVVNSQPEKRIEKRTVTETAKQGA